MFLGLRTAKYEVQDMAKAKEWYSKALGIEPYFDQPAFYVGYNVGGYDLGLVPAPKAETKRAPRALRTGAWKTRMRLTNG